MSKLLLINGPRECGKSKAVTCISERFPVTSRRCKDKLFKLVPEYFCISESTFWDIYEDRLLKEVPLPEFTVTQNAYRKLQDVLPDLPGCDAPMVELSVRQAMIFVSEVVCKPNMGRQYFGQHRANQIQSGEWAIDDSCGFVDELPPVIHKLGQDNILLVRVTGRGDFDGSDSRQFIPDGIIDTTMDVDNSGDEADYLDTMVGIASMFFGEAPSWQAGKDRVYEERTAELIRDELEGFVTNPGVIPVKPWCQVQIKRIDGTQDTGAACLYPWVKRGVPSDIEKYRVITPE